MSLIDKYLPRYQFSERHRTHISASPDMVIRSVLELDRPPDRLRNILLALRTIPSRLLGRQASRVGFNIFTALDQDEKSEMWLG